VPRCGAHHARPRRRHPRPARPGAGTPGGRIAMTPLLRITPAVAEALQAGRPVVALESTLIAHGLPWPLNLETARAAEAAVRADGAVPATIAVWHGRPTVGLNEAELEYLARTPGVRKASRRDLGAAVAQGACAATTVAATLALAHRAGLRVFATGGIGGVHPAPAPALGPGTGLI